MNDLKSNDISNKYKYIGKSIISDLKSEKRDRNFIRNLDDYVPNLIYLGYEDFVIKKVEEILFDEKKLCKGFLSSKLPNIIRPQENDEWLGGLLYIKKYHSSKIVDYNVKNIFKKMENEFLKYNVISSFGICFNQKIIPAPVFNPRSGTILEELITAQFEMRNDLKIKQNWLQVLKNSFDNPYFEEKNIFPHSTYLNDFYFLNDFRDFFQIPNSLAIRFFPSLADIFPSKARYSPAKSNSSMLHALIAALRFKNFNWLKIKLNQFIEGISEDFLTSNGFIRRSKRSNEARLSTNHPIIDALCDAFYFTDKKNKKYIDLAQKIADSWIEIKLPTNLFPKYKKCNYSWLDDQIDLAISFGRLYELTSKEKYLEESRELIKSTLKYHYSKNEKKLFENVDDDGELKNLRTSPKYNSLAIKGLIYLKEILDGDKNIYGNDLYYYDLLKDR